MDDDSILSEINDFAADLNRKNRMHILAQIILLLEAQRQGISEFPLEE